VGFGKYLKAAFLYHWNLLAFAGGMGFALLSGVGDVLVPLVLAGEVAYLGLLGTHPKFQKYVDAQEAKEEREEGAAKANQNVRRILNSLPRNLVERFEALRGRCLELRRIAQELRDPNRAGEPMPLEELQLAGLDRLLWIYLRLLFTQYSLERFLQATTEAQIQQDIKNLEGRLKALPRETDNPQTLKKRKSIADNLETSRARLANHQKARDNMEMVKLEIDRLENKIRSLSELAVNRQEPDFIAGQVDQVVQGMVQTERTMSELQFATGLSAEEEVPELVQRQTVPSRK
jgi:chemotaxis protein histidine kinase CheA